MNVVLAGEESAGLRTLRLIEASGHRVAGVLTSPPGQRRAGASLWTAARRAGHPVLPAERVADPSLAADLRRLGVDLLLNVHSLHLVHPEVLAAPEIGSFNLHPGPLPRYAGLDTVSWALYRGEAEYGVTVHEMVERPDAGGIAFETSFPVPPGATALALYARCIREGLTLIGRLLETAAAEGRVPVRAQDLSRREYFRRGAPQRGRLSWRRSAPQVRGFVRACDYGPFPSPWDHPRTALGGREIAVLQVELTGQPAEAPPGAVESAGAGARLVACADEWIEVRAVEVDGRRSRPDAVIPAGARLD